MIENIHTCCLSYQKHGFLILGPSGSGKSDLCLRLIMDKQAVLVADDRCDIWEEDNKLFAKAPQNLQGLLEVRGVGISKFPFINRTSVSSVIELVANPLDIERLPQPEFYQYGQIKLPKLRLYPFEPSAADKVIVFIERITCEDL